MAVFITDSDDFEDIQDIMTPERKWRRDGTSETSAPITGGNEKYENRVVKKIKLKAGNCPISICQLGIFHTDYYIDEMDDYTVPN